jgi:SpoVK/Ycf46/Vps4 family AAA+-type ATPase
VKCLFSAARLVAPSVIFLDEVDAFVSSRGSGNEHESSRRMKTEFFAQMDGIVATQATQRTLVLATTNCPWDLDTAILRRFEKRIYVPLPDLEAREEHFKLLLQELHFGPDTANGTLAVEIDLEDTARFLAHLTAGYSSADIVSVCREAAMSPMRRLLSRHTIHDLQRMRETASHGSQQQQQEQLRVQRSDFVEALQKTKPSVPAAMISRYETWNQLYGTLAPS